MGIKATLPKGTECTLNGLEVVLDEKLNFTVKNAEHIDQAAEFTHIHGLPCDFSHVDPDSGKQVTYNGLDASRIETDVAEVEAEAKAAAEAASKAPKGKK